MMKKMTLLNLVCLATMFLMSCADVPNEKAQNKSQISQACTNPDQKILFGPEKFISFKGKPKNVTRSFTISEHTNATIKIRSHGVLHGWIYLDGELIVSPESLKHHKKHYSKNIDLEAGDHELSVQVASKPGRKLVIVIVGSEGNFYSACTDGQVVLGPEVFTRMKGKPKTETREFNLPQSAKTCLVLHNNGVSSAWIHVDGNLIMSPKDFNPHTTDLTETLNLAAGLHELSVHIASKPGSSLDITIRAEVADPCDGVVCDTPPDNECMNENTLLIYQAPGMCFEGNCTYPTDQQACPYGCEDGACNPPQCKSGDCCENGFFKPSGVICREIAGSCDIEEVCSGDQAHCPEDSWEIAGMECRPANDICDAPEYCTGQGPTCPQDGFALAGTECRSASGRCDVAEICTGTDPGCPQDSFIMAGAICRPIAGHCDIAEVCTGVDPACPQDVLAPTGTECRPAVGICDTAEACTGTDATCPVDMFKPASTECRSAVGVCDIAEHCIGHDAQCPEDGFVSAGIVCRITAGACDIEESCTGNLAECPPDEYAASGVLCRPAAGLCDLAESCSGANVHCPTDQFQPNTTQCGTIPIAEEFSCSDQACGADAIQRVQMQYCTGLTGACDESNLIWNDWEIVEDCAQDALCQYDVSSAFCMVCEHGCMDATCQSGLPPDPSQVAPPLDRIGVTPFDQAVSFLYTGTNPIQTGVDPGVMEERRIAVLKGIVTDRDGLPIPGVTISVLDHPEFGQTLTREDGKFDLAVNGGGWLTVQYAKEEYLPVQRKLDAPWNDYAWLPDVVMIPLDNQVTEIFLDSAIDMQVAQGSLVTDEDGTRQATVLFPVGTEAALVFSDGSTQPLSTLNVRATEYTVGPTGPQAMPGELPPATGYTYAVELSADEALLSGARNVVFNQSVPFYVENFLDFSIGINVPVGYYDHDKGEWIAIPDGRIVKITAIVDDVAQLDIDGNDIADDTASLEELGITASEQTRLAELYSEGQSLWRVTLPHFSPIDCNWPWGCEEDPNDEEEPTACKQPNQPPPDDNQSMNDPCKKSGSILTCQNQTLGQRVEVEGTSYTLNYRSDRVPGRKVERTLNINVTGEEVPWAVYQIAVQLRVAGEWYIYYFDSSPNQKFLFVWDGKDTYDRLLHGTYPLPGSIGYVYPIGRTQAREGAEGSFGLPGDAIISDDIMRSWFTTYQPFMKYVTIWDEKSRGLGGWSLSMHHAYDPAGRTIYLGEGERIRQNFRKISINTVAGDGRGGTHGDGGPATEASLYNPIDVATASDGSYYINSSGRIRRVDPNGIITTVAGGGNSRDEGIPATDYLLHNPAGIDVDADGNLYITNYDNVPTVIPHKVHKVDTTGVIRTIAGGRRCQVGDDIGDGGLATEACLGLTKDVVAAPDGSLFISDHWQHRIRRVGPDGIITTYAGGGTSYEDGIPATDAKISYPNYLALAKDGTLYMTSSNIVRRVGPDGIITTVAGNGQLDMDAVPATEVYLTYLQGITIGKHGELFITEGGNKNRIRKISQGIITTCGGNASKTGCHFIGDGGSPTQASLCNPTGLAISPDESLLVADAYNNRLRKIDITPNVFEDVLLVPSEDSPELYIFNKNGHHLRTLDSRTGVILYSFEYDPNGYLTSVTDVDGQVTSIERNGLGNPTAIVAPFGQRTDFTLNTNGYIESITNPASESYSFHYSTDGLMESMLDPRQGVHIFEYDELGRLVKDINPVGFLELSLSKTPNQKTVSIATALGRTTTYLVEKLVDGALRFLNTFPGGVQNESIQSTNASQSVAFADGTIVDTLEGPDPRWGMSKSFVKNQTITTPSGLQLNQTRGKTVTLTDPYDLLSLETVTDTTDVNGRIYVETYEAAQRLMTGISPMGRRDFTWLDEKGRVHIYQLEGLEPMEFVYNNQGKIDSITEGTGVQARLFQLTYDNDGNLDTVTDPLLRTVSYDYDLAGRVTRQVLPDGRDIIYAYDSNGNITSITPPGRPKHEFTYTPIDQQKDYLPPNLITGPTSTHYDYNLDGQLELVTRPDGKLVDLQYDNAGRLESIFIPTGQLELVYESTTGQLASITAPDGGLLAYAWDGMLLTGTSWAGQVAGSVTRTYDNDFRLSSIWINGAHEIPFGYDDDNLLVQAGGLSLGRDPQNGLVAGSSLGQVSTNRTYNGFGELESYTAAFGGTPIFETQYVRDALGRITEKTETIASVTTVYDYIYDRAGRLHEVQRDGVTVSVHDYDPNSNRVAYTDETGMVTTGSYDHQDRMLSYGNATYTYTANGELRTKTVHGQTTTYTYDVLGNLTDVTLPDGTQIHYIIDGRNRRVGKQLNGTLVQGFLYQDQLNPVAELDGSGNIVSLFVYGSRMNVPEYMIKDGVICRIVTDYLGSPRWVVNVATGAVVQRMEYDEFGRMLADNNSGFQPFGFAGGLYDPTIGLVHFGARDYDPEMGRWTSKDPILFDGGETNLYGYVLNDPINFLDPYGLGWLDDLSNFFAGFGDTITFGGTRWLRRKLGIKGGVDPCSGWYTAGQVGGAAWWVITAGAVGSRLAGWQTRIALHGPHHSFRVLGRLSHIQMNIWKAGIRGSGRTIFRIPLLWR